ncbi:hypothetical protein SDC9_88799 [bioreactor metagenome]|uniref:Uncharacterized protein n=1 Tax=bioreactor metagenome TaxID=1076179 RepID=A0A644ZN28_9ZZZZ
MDFPSLSEGGKPNKIGLRRIQFIAIQVANCFFHVLALYRTCGDARHEMLLENEKHHDHGYYGDCRHG